MSLQPLGVRIRRTLRLGPAETLHMVRRQVDVVVTPRVTPVWTSVAARLARVAPAGDVATATYVGVPDGHTLSLQAVLPAGIEPQGTSATVVFRHARTEHRTPAALRADPDGRWYAEATALLGRRPGGIPLGRGAWHLRIELTAAAGGRRRLPVRRPLPDPVRTGPTVAAPPCPDTGTRFRPVTTPLGACRIVVTPGRPAAEVVRFTMGCGTAAIVGRFVGVRDTTGATAEFRRGDGTVREEPVSASGDVFRIGLPLAAFRPGTGGEQIWEAVIRLADGCRLQVGRFLHDLEHIRRTLRPYDRPVVLPGGTAYRLRLQYTLAGRLNLICSNTDTGEQG